MDVTHHDSAMNKFVPLASLKEESVIFRCIRFAAVALILWVVYLIGSGIESLENRQFYWVFAIILLWYAPRAIYTRYKRVILNEELGTGWKARKISERLVYATKKQLSESFVFVMTGLMAWFGLVIKSPEAVQTLALAGGVTFAVSLLMMLPPLRRFYKEDKYPSVFPFYRRSIAAIAAGVACFLLAYLRFQPHLDGEAAFKTLTISVTQTPESFNGFLTALRDSMNIWAALMNYGLSYADGTSWHALTRAFLIALPYGILGAHFGIVLGVLTLPGSTLRAIMARQQWIKTDRGVFKRYWKTVALPLFLIAFFGAGTYYGYPYYVKYQDKIIITADSDERSGKIDIIEDKYYKTGTIKSIENEKAHAVSRLKGLVNNAVNEVNIVFSEAEDKLEPFVEWYTEERKTRRFPVGNELLKETYKNSLDLFNLNLKLQNIRKELGQQASRVYSDLGIYIDTLMKNNEIALPDDEETSVGRKFTMEEINTLKLPGGDLVPVRQTFRMKTQLPEVIIDLLDDFDVAATPWFQEVLSKEEQSMEDDIFNDLENGEDSDAAPKQDQKSDKDQKKPEKQKKMSAAEAELLGLALDPEDAAAENAGEAGDGGDHEGSEAEEQEDNGNPLLKHGLAMIRKEKNLVIQSLYDGLEIPYRVAEEQDEAPSGKIDPEETEDNDAGGLTPQDERELFGNESD